MQAETPPPAPLPATPLEGPPGERLALSVEAELGLELHLPRLELDDRRIHRDRSLRGSLLETFLVNDLDREIFPLRARPARRVAHGDEELPEEPRQLPAALLVEGGEQASLVLDMGGDDGLDELLPLGSQLDEA